MAPKNIKILYFDARGRGEISRLVLAAAGQKFEDVRFTRETWPAEKPNTPFGQLPVLEIDGKRYAQSVAISTYLAREFGFYGKTNLDGLQIDQVIQLGVDFWNAATKYFMESDAKKKEELLKNLKDVETPKYLTFFEKLLKDNKTGYFVGSGLTLADLFVYDLMYFLKKQNMLPSQGFPGLQELYNKVVSNNNIKAYLAQRKETEN
ncbi:glutathione S-transferase 7 [Biomphalaria glabrata]|nr:glutathione S-transferase 7 [Biomphalaria glabrata]